MKYTLGKHSGYNINNNLICPYSRMCYSRFDLSKILYASYLKLSVSRGEKNGIKKLEIRAKFSLEESYVYKTFNFNSCKHIVKI